MAMLVTGAPVLLVALQGKLEPSAARGDLSGVPYDAGDDIIMWALPVAKRVTAVAARADLREGMFLEGVMLLLLGWLETVGLLD